MSQRPPVPPTGLIEASRLPLPFRVPAAGAPRPIFLHGMWRSGSTYVWSCFRQAERALCYYEPLAQGLERLTRARIPRDTADRVSANRHPALDRPYFAEYASLLRGRGVPGFQPRFTFDRFVLAPGERHEPLRRYIAGLAAHAAGQGLAPVFGFNQTSLRVGWLRQGFDSVDIQVERHPRDIWGSYMDHLGRGNHTYFRNWLMVAERNADHPLIAPLAERLPLRRGLARLAKPKPYYAGAIERLGPEALYELVVYVWLACALEALGYCDIIVDTGLADRPRYARELAEKVRMRTGLAVNFDALRSPPPAGALSREQFDRVERRSAALFSRALPASLASPQVVRGRLGELCGRKAALLGLVL